MDLSLLTDNENKALEVYLGRLKVLFGPRLRELRIYGSVVREERWEESDVDLLVLIKGLTWDEKRRVWDEATNVNIEFETLLSPLVMRPEELQELKDRERRIALDIDREGVEVPL